MSKLYCEQCDRMVQFKNIKKRETFKVFDESIEIESTIAICNVCENELFLEEFEVENQRKAFDIYRERNNILSVDEIKEIRKKYELTQREMSKLMGWGEITYHRYENGSIPNASHNNQLLLMQQPENVKMILNNGSHNLPEDKVNDLRQVLKKIIFDSAIRKNIFLRTYKSNLKEYNQINIISEKKQWSYQYLEKSVSQVEKRKH